MAYVTDQTSEELRQYMKKVTSYPNWNDPLVMRLWKEVQEQDKSIAAHRLAKSFFKAALFGSILIMALWGMNAEASPSEYEPPPPKTVAKTLMEIGDSCLNREIMVLSVVNSEGVRIYYSFLCKLMFTSEKPPHGE